VNQPSSLPQAIGKYRLIAPIGRGGMAHIFLARMSGPSGFSKLFVMKVLRDELREGGDECVTMFLDEARLAARLSHPNIVQTYDVGEANGHYYIAMEYLEGQALRFVERRLGRHGFPEPQYLRVLAQTARALHHAHELRDYDGTPLQVVHRDVSPQNVFVTYDGRVKLLDFGIAKADNAEHLTKVGVIKGKVDYIAPEQIRGEQVDRRADIFSLGVMLFEAITHVRFAGGSKVSEVTKMHDRVTGREPRVREVRDDVPGELEHICERAIALDPADRTATALEFAEDLERYLVSANLRPEPEQLAAAMEPAFREERAQIARVVQQQMMLRTEETGPLQDSQAPGPPSARPAANLEELAPRMRKVRWGWVGGIVSAALVIAVYLALPTDPREARASAGSLPAAQPPSTPPQPAAAKTQPLPSHPAARVASPEPPAHENSRTRPARASVERSRKRASEAPAHVVHAVAEPVPAAPAPAPVVHHAEPEPGADFNNLAPARAKKRGDIELEEGLYE
jgi:serine/threonine protein kinase